MAGYVAAGLISSLGFFHVVPERVVPEPLAEAKHTYDVAWNKVFPSALPTTEVDREARNLFTAATSQIKGPVKPEGIHERPPVIPPSFRPPTHGAYDFAVVGGGIIGTATARQLLLEYPNATVCLLEKEAHVGVHQSSHNSGVIHAGIYDPPSTLKSQLVVRGSRMLFEYCEKHGLPAKRVGKLVVALTEAQLPQLEEYKARGDKAGQKGLEIISADRLKEMEPHVTGLGALYSPNTGVTDYAAITRRMAQEVSGAAPLTALASASRKVNAKAANKKPNRGAVLLNKEVLAVHDMGTHCRVTAKEVGQDGPETSVAAKVVVTAAGLHMDEVGAVAGGRSLPRVVPFRGRFYQLVPSKTHLISRNVYPCKPSPSDVGVHFTPMVSEMRGEGVIVGPCFSLALHREGYRASRVEMSQVVQYATSPSFWKFAWSMGISSIAGQCRRDLSKQAFVEQARRLVPCVTAADFEPSYAGVMAQTFEPSGEATPDFSFEITAAVRDPHMASLENVSGAPTIRRPVPRVINLRNAPSPGATASMAIAEHVAALVEQDMKVALAG